jgi:hypothetical protein
MSTQETYFKPVTIPELPDVGSSYLPANAFVRFIFGMHGTAEEFAPAAEFLEESEIVIPELPGWTPEHLTWFRNVSRSGVKNFEKLLRHRTAQTLEIGNSYHRTLINAIQGSKKTVLFIDAPHSAKLKSPYQIKMRGANFDQLIDRVYEQLVTTAEGSARRDQIIVESLGPFVTQAITAHPRLKEQSSVAALVILGANHERVYQHLRNSVDEGSVTASVTKDYVGSAVNQYFLELRQQIEHNQPLSRQALLGAMAAMCLNNILAMRINKYDSVCDEERAQDAIFKRLVKDMNNDSVSSVETLINCIVNKNISPADKDQAAAYVQTIEV